MLFKKRVNEPRKHRLLEVAATVSCTFTLALSDQAPAMGDLGSNIWSFWHQVVASYWWASYDDYRAATNGLLSAEAQKNATLAGEIEPVGIVTTEKSSRPSHGGGVGCDDFRIVRFSDFGGPDAVKLPFRVHQPKSALYYEFSGLMSGFGWPSSATFFLAAMLPEGAEPLFNDGGVGINASVLSRAFLAQSGDGNGMPTIPANQIVLVDTVQCSGLAIYVSEYER